MNDLLVTMHTAQRRLNEGRHIIGDQSGTKAEQRRLGVAQGEVLVPTLSRPGCMSALVRRGLGAEGFHGAFDRPQTQFAGPAMTPSLHQVRRLLGFTLFELLLALAIVGILASLAYSGYESYSRRARNSLVMSDIRSIEQCIERYHIMMDAFPPDLATAGCNKDDPWGNPYRYLNMADAEGKFRKDKNLHPLNSDYDLYSMGPDGKSVAPLTAKASRDDIIRANNGDYIGLASDY